MNNAQTVGEFLFATLHEMGVTHAFGIPGDFALPTFRWLDRSALSLITLTHEPSVGFAADGYARMSNNIGVACVTYCVGGLNMLNAVACAYAEKSPLLVISGGPSAQDRRNDPLIHHKVRHFDTQRRIYEEVTCASTVLLDPSQAAQEILRVIAEVQKQCRPGYIEIPFDVVDMPITLPHAPLAVSTPELSNTDHLAAAIEDACAMIAAASQPVIIADVELHRHGLTDMALALAEKLNIPIASTLLSKSVISEHHPHFMGVYSGGLSQADVQAYVESSDCVILLGAFISDVFLGMNTARLNAKQCLLATTEQIRIGHRRYDKVQLSDFIEALCAQPLAAKPKSAHPVPPPTPAPFTPQELAEPLSIASFFRIIGLHLGENNTVICDTGDALLGALSLRTAKPNHFLSDAYYLSMGFAVPASIGAMAANPHSRVFCIVGDGAFQMTGTELSTAARYGMAPIVFVLNNDGYGTQRHILDGPFNEILQWNYAQLPSLLGKGFGRKVSTNHECIEALKAALAQDAPAIIEVMIPREDCSEPLRRMGEELGKLRDTEKRTR
jgi:indolepyruvate decarboxylase